jgi:hypothetical protein
MCSVYSIAGLTLVPYNLIAHREEQWFSDTAATLRPFVATSSAHVLLFYNSKSATVV